MLRQPVTRVLLLTLIVGALAWSVACEFRDVEAEKTRALQIAQQWVADNTEVGVDSLVQLVIGEAPGAEVVSDILEDEINRRLTWTYSEADCPPEDACSVTATVSAEGTFDLPLLGSRSFSASLPIDLRIVNPQGEVTWWTPQASQATVTITETGG